ncbi:MAG: hypothetical protein AAGK21_07640 [Bacteroidota bacterium]
MLRFIVLLLGLSPAVWAQPSPSFPTIGEAVEDLERTWAISIEEGDPFFLLRYFRAASEVETGLARTIDELHLATLEGRPVPDLSIELSESIDPETTGGVRVLDVRTTCGGGWTRRGTLVIELGLWNFVVLAVRDEALPASTDACD